MAFKIPLLDPQSFRYASLGLTVSAFSFRGLRFRGLRFRGLRFRGLRFRGLRSVVCVFEVCVFETPVNKGLIVHILSP